VEADHHPCPGGGERRAGRAPGEALWPERFGVDYLNGFKRRNPRGFNALYQQRPTPDDGDFFKAEYIREYLPHEVPPREKLRIYMASDHAVAQKQENDRTCILVVGVDVNDNIWVLDCFWKRAKTDEVVEKLIALFKKWKPLRWWAEDDHITKSIGPFLRKRMRESQVYMAHSKVNAYADKLKKAQAIQGRMSMGMVLFPKTAPWYQDARDEILKFPRARHDDFVDALSTLGRGMGVMVAPAAPAPVSTGPSSGPSAG
jgi:predicted phage terminase large subunit-like protein